MGRQVITRKPGFPVLLTRECLEVVRRVLTNRGYSFYNWRSVDEWLYGMGPTGPEREVAYIFLNCYRENYGRTFRQLSYTCELGWVNDRMMRPYPEYYTLEPFKSLLAMGLTHHSVIDMIMTWGEDGYPAILNSFITNFETEILNGTHD